MLPDLVSLALFLRAVESRSLSKAARERHLALAAASRRIAILEHCYGTQLLYRSAKGVEPTPAGKALAFHAQKILGQEQLLRAELSSYSQGVKGHVRIQANTSAITQHLPRDLAVFSHRYPEVKIELVESRSHVINQNVREGRTDIGIVMSGDTLEGISYLPYQQDRLAAVVPRGHELKSKTVPFARILDYDLVGLDSDTAMMRLLLQAAADLSRPLRLSVEVASFEAVCKFVQAGVGIGVLPENAARNFAKEMGLRIIKLTDRWATRQMLICFRGMDALPLAGRKLVELLADPDTEQRLSPRDQDGG